MFCGSGYDCLQEVQPPGTLAQNPMGAWILASNGVIMRKFGGIEMAAYPKADSRRLPVFVFMSLLLSFCACTAENQNSASTVATLEEAVGEASSEERFFGSSEAISLGSSETVKSVLAETEERSNAGTITAVKSDQTTQSEKEGIGNYTLVQGEELPICREFLENLNFYKGKGETPMACDMRIAPQFEKFITLDWEDMPIEEEFLKNLVYDRFSGSFPPESKESLDNRWKSFYTTHLGRYKIPDAELSISKAPVQVFKDGRKSYALRLGNKNWCAYVGAAGGDVFILADNQRIDTDSYPFSKGGGQSGGNLFYYNGKIRNFETSFKDNIEPWNPSHKIYPAVVRIYDITEGTSSTFSIVLVRHEICIYTYE